MFKVQFVLDAFGSDAERAASESYLQIMLRALYAIDRVWLRTHPEAPRLYDSGVRYRPEPVGQENWQDLATTLRIGYGDCEDLAAARAAELAERDNVDAIPVFRWRRDGSLSLYHILVRYPDGQLEDPSERLGMRKSVDARKRWGLLWAA